MRLEDSACPMLCTDDAGIVSNSAEALAKMIKIRFDHLRSGRPHGFGKKKKTTLLQTQELASQVAPFVIEAGGQMYKQTMKFLCLGGVIYEDANLMLDIKRWVPIMRACCKRLVCNMRTARLSLTVRLLKAEVIETLLCGCVTWTLNATHYDELRKAHP